MACDDSSGEKGMALVTVILMLTVLLTLAHVLVEKVWQSTRQTAEAASREQLFWAAQAGIEATRSRLASDYASTGGWQSLLLADDARSYPATPAWTSVINGRSVEIYLRDNPDGDGDAQRDNDLKLFVLARARGRKGAEAIIESLCGFDPSSASDAAAPSGSAASQILGDLDNQPVDSYDILE
jgi:hypothetical protein